MANPDDRTPKRKLLVIGPSTRKICWKNTPTTGGEPGLQEGTSNWEVDLGRAEQCRAVAEIALQKKTLEEKLAGLSSNEAVYLARAKLAKDELAKEQRHSKQVAAEADSRVRQKQSEMEGKMKKLETEWRGRMARKNADIDQLRVRNKWLWDELQAARSRIKRQTAPSSPKIPQLVERKPMTDAELQGRKKETEAKFRDLDSHFDDATPTANEFNALMDDIDGIMAALRRDKDELLLANQALKGRLEEVQRGAYAQSKELTETIEARRSYMDSYIFYKDQFKLMGIHGRDMEARAMAAEAEVKRLQAAEARREKGKTTANSKVEGMDAGAAYLMGFDECKTLANLLCAGIGKDLQYPLGTSPQRDHQIGEGARGAGTPQEPINLNDSPPSQ